MKKTLSIALAALCAAIIAGDPYATVERLEDVEALAASDEHAAWAKRMRQRLIAQLGSDEREPARDPEWKFRR